ncbi:hypothetical protein [Sphingorhabdus sp. Alg239-R122]|uniref:hypothetical protein n=1 Tax=Sphingorhabdus sp. Alg239-R122 TaxID=2305989 RepID=UPI0013DB2D19|nr:hypothetical protein [Sphingorhabdus sp. Alg239-R122]
MTRINNVDQLVLILREKLEAASRLKKSGKSSKARRAAAPTNTRDVDIVQDLLGSGNFTENDVQHALIQGILSQEFGDRLVNDAKFQQIVSQVVAIINRDPELRGLFAEATRELGEGGKGLGLEQENR